MNFPCLYCQHPLQGYKHYDTVGANYLAWLWNCLDCKITYKVDFSNAWVSYRCAWPDNNEYYLVSWISSNETFIYHVDNSDASSDVNEVLHLLHLIHNLTPTNLLDKIKTLLTFS